MKRHRAPVVFCRIRVNLAAGRLRPVWNGGNINRANHLRLSSLIACT